MSELLTIILQTVIEVLRGLWQKLAGRRKPVPVPVPVRRHSLPASLPETFPFSRTVLKRPLLPLDDAWRPRRH